jgi:cation-transporting P-type ATPase I
MRMNLRERLKKVASLFEARQRRVWVGDNRAHLEFRELDVDELITFRQSVIEHVVGISGVLWLDVNPFTRRVVVAFEGTLDIGRIKAAVEAAEHAAFCAAVPFCQAPLPHPADEEPLTRLAVEITADLVGLLLGGTLRALPAVPTSRSAATVASTLTLVKSSERWRKGIDEKLGPERTDIILGIAIAFGNALAQRPIVSAADATHKTFLLREARARHNVWRRREPELCATPMVQPDTLRDLPRRAFPMPPGPIEEYAKRAWIVSLTGFMFSFLTTRSWRRAGAAVYGGVPKPAKLGRDVFCAELSRILANRNVVVMDPAALRRLDRVNCLVLAEDVVSQSHYTLHEFKCLDGVDRIEAHAKLAAIFDADHALETQRSGEWSIQPLGLDPDVSDLLTPDAEVLAETGNLIVELRQNGSRLALGAIELEPRTGLEELVAAAQRAKMRVYVASDNSEVLDQLSADDRIPTNVQLTDAVIRLQSEGHVVCTLASNQPDALRVSDCGIGLHLEDRPTPWGAHIICGPDLSDVEFLIGATVVARQISRQSVNIALAAATMGTLVSAGGLLPLSSRRVVNAVNTATIISMVNGVRAARTLARQPTVTPRDRTPWHVLPIKGVMKRLQTSELGLTPVQVAKRRAPTSHKKTAVVELFECITDELFNPLAPLLAAGAGLSAVAGSAADAVMVSAVVVLNACVGGVQKFRTEHQIRDLSAVVRRLATVHRDGKILEIDATDLVPGDVVVLSTGDVVPADCRILHAESVEVDTSSLTGESLPVERNARPCFQPSVADRSSMLYAGTTIAAGRVTGIVVAAGQDTETARGGSIVGRIAPPSGVEQRLLSLINLTAPVALGAGLGLVGAGLLRGRRVEHLVPAGVSLAVASVPEGLPLLATAAQLAAARRLAARGALVRNPRCIEALGRVDTLCLDKTGTLTVGHLELVGITRGAALVSVKDFGAHEHRVLNGAIRAAPDPQYDVAHNDPTDAALFRAAATNNIGVEWGKVAWEREEELPYEPGRGYHAVIGCSGAERRLEVKGAPEVVLRMSSSWLCDSEEILIDQSTRDALRHLINGLARQGLRLLAVATCNLEPDQKVDLQSLQGMRLVGITAFSDPIRPTAKRAIERMRKAGVDSLLITGDHPETAASVARELGLIRDRRIMSGTELQLLDDDELDSIIATIGVFARVTPSQKARIVRSLQRIGRVVAMVGDGANDAPAIRLAHVGIAIGELSTSAARGAADVVLTDERIDTLVEAVTEGRAMWASVRDAVSILVGGNLGEIGFTLGAGLIDGRAPLSPRQLLLVNLLTDVAPAMAIALRPPPADRYEELANEGPDASLGRPLNREIATRAFITAFGAGSAWAFARLTGTRDRAQTVGLLALVGTQLGQTIASGGFTRPVVVTSLASTALLAGIVQTPGVSQFFDCRPLGPLGWATAIGASTIATGIALAFPQLTSSVASRLNPIDQVLKEPVRPTLVPPPSQAPDEERAPLSTIDRVKGLFSEHPPFVSDT